jgi:hypothetical protein
MAESKGWQVCPTTAQSEKKLGFGAQNFDRSFYPIFKSVSYAGAESSVFGRFLLLL